MRIEYLCNWISIIYHINIVNFLYLHQICEERLGARMKPSGIGGMAVMEGVMMKNKDEYAVAVRKPDNEIVVEKNTYKDFTNKVKFFKLPIFRGMLAFVDSMVIGVKVLSFSASFFDDDEEQVTSKKNKKTNKQVNNKAEKKSAVVKEELSATVTDHENQDEEKTQDKKENRVDGLLMAGVVLLSTCFSVGLFMLLPFFISNLFSKLIKTEFLLTLVEGLIRITIFIGYIFIISRMPEIKRFFMYHGAEHKTINCLENGFELTVENVRWQTKVHKRCGTSFMLLVMIISVLLFFLLPPMSLLWRVISRILLVPVIAGISYEFIRLAGRSENKLVNIISKPGLWMQGLTTREPDDAMIEVAIQSVEAVFDWRSFLETSATKEADTVKESEQVEKVEKAAAEKKNAGNKAKAQSSVAKSTASKKVQGNDAKQVKKATPTEDKPGSSIRQKAVLTKDISIKSSPEEDEDDDILKALDKYLDFK